MNPTLAGTDGDLLAAFAQTGNQAAFAELVRRHGPMVQAVGVRVLNDHHAAEDLTQAVFVVLARKAESLRRDPSLAGWLYTVTRRLALTARQSRQSRQQREQIAMSQQPDPTTTAVDATAFRAELDDVLGQLPDRYRQPLVLFHLQSKSLDETGRLLGLNPNTLRTRLARARELLRKKLVRRGVTVGSVGALTVLLSTESGAATLPATFVASTVGAATGGSVSTTVAALTKGALNMLFWNSVKTAALTAVCVGAVGTGVVVAQRATNATPAPAAAKTKVLDINDTWGKLVEVAADGTVALDITVGGDSQAQLTFRRLTIPAADGYAEAVKQAAAKFQVGDMVKVFEVCEPARDDGTRKVWALAVCSPADPMPPELRALELTGFGAAPRAVTGDPAKVFKPIDQNQSGTYGDGKWNYSYTITGGYSRGFLKYDGRDLPSPQPGDFILTPWGWMQWQEKAHWLPVAEKPAKGAKVKVGCVWNTAKRERFVWELAAMESR